MRRDGDRPPSRVFMVLRRGEGDVAARRDFLDNFFGFRIDFVGVDGLSEASVSVGCGSSPGGEKIFSVRGTCSAKSSSNVARRRASGVCAGSCSGAAAVSSTLAGAGSVSSTTSPPLSSLAASSAMSSLTLFLVLCVGTLRLYFAFSLAVLQYHPQYHPIH